MPSETPTTMLRSSSGFFESLKNQIIVIKVGTSSLLHTELYTLRLSMLAQLSELVRKLKDQGHHVVIVSSGAVGVGCNQMGLKRRPTDISELQAMAAIGQVHLMRYYDDVFSAVGLKCGQLLLDGDVFARRHQYLNTRNTLRALFNNGTIPIVNENDTVAVEELRIGDNDTLSAKVAMMCEANWLFLMTDVPCLYNKDPRDNPDAVPIRVVEDVHRLAVDAASQGTKWGSGGMKTKLTAARLATSAGTTVVVCSSKDAGVVMRIMDGEEEGTLFMSTGGIKGRKRWILSVPVRGSICMDDGAVEAVQEKHQSLFAAGIVATEGDFEANDCVSLCNKDGEEFGRGLANYSQEAMETVKGKSSSSFQKDLKGYTADEMVFRANICLFNSGHWSDGSN